jgi:DNA-binding SARP family transcriptional activator
MIRVPHHPRVRWPLARDRDGPPVAAIALPTAAGAPTDPLPAQVYLPWLRPPLRLVSFGGFAVWQGGVPLGVGVLRPKARLLLAALLCARGPLHRHALLRWLWSHLPPTRAAHALRTTVYELRRALEPPAGRGRGPSVIAVEDMTYRLELRDDDEWDVADFLRLAGEADAAADPRERLVLLTAAEERSRGELFPEWPEAPWVRGLRQAVEETRREVLAGLAELLSGAGRLDEAVKRYRALVEREPECEEWHRALMRLYARLGERGLALRQYRRCRDALAALGVEPSPPTAVLAAQLFRVVSAAPLAVLPAAAPGELG